MRHNFIIINVLKISAVVLINLQTSPSSCSYFIQLLFSVQYF